MRILLLGLLVVVSGLAGAKPAPSFRAEKLDGQRVALQDLLSPGRGTLLSFWATWCVPCIQELNAVTKHLKDDPKLALDLVSVNVDKSDTASQVRPLVKEKGFHFPILMDPQHLIFGKYQATPELPYSVLISPSGEILETFQGYNESMFQSVRKHLQKVSAAP